MNRIFLALVFILFSFVAQADFDTGVAAFEKGNYRVAFENFLPLTEGHNGITGPCYYVGYMYTYGLGVEKNRVKGEDYLARAAALGSPEAWAILKKEFGILPEPDVFYKPIIYLYPEEITNVTVELGYPKNTTHTYPKYQGPWQVQAEPNGDLTDLKNGRHYYALYWEGKNTISSAAPTEGFVVKGSDTISFLEEKLAELGLTEREAEEFIIYWLPKLENAPYNFIRFQTLSEQNKNMPLKITPAPKTLIRVMMEYDNLTGPIKVAKQKLPKTPKRTGFTVVEWGGTKLNLKERP